MNPEPRIPISPRFLSQVTSLSRASITAHRVVLLALLLPGFCAAQVCQPVWSDAFSNNGFSGGDIRAMLRFSIAGQSHVIATGHFDIAGGPANRIARWDGWSWRPFGSGIQGTPTNFAVGGYALAVFDDGAGPELYVGGLFDTVDGVQASNIARWNGAAWLPLGDGVNDTVRALAVYDDGAGPALYIGGLFTIAGGSPAQRIARYRNGQWASFGGLTGGRGVFAMTAADVGTGEALFVGGDFTDVNGVPSRSMARFDSAGWSPIGATLPASVWTQGTVLAIIRFEDQHGPAIFAGGDSPTGCGTVIKWQDEKWTRLIQCTGGFVSALAGFDDGQGPALYAGGNFTGIWRLRSGTWSTIASSGTTRALFVDDDPPSLCAAGAQHPLGPQRWDGSEWHPWTPPRGVVGGGSPNVMAWHDDGAGPALYVGGSFTGIGTLTNTSFARWNGHEWSRIDGTGTPFPQGTVYALTTFDDGSGLHLYAGGNFTFPSPHFSYNILRWNGAAWSGIFTSPGLSNPVTTLQTLTINGQSRLYAGGTFWYVESQPLRGIFAWDGQSIETFGGGIAGPGSGQDAVVNAIVAFDGGHGEQLHIAGRFLSAGGTTVSSIARWDGAAWHALNEGLRRNSAPATVSSMVVMNTPSGRRLFVSGSIDEAGGATVQGLARWDGFLWQAVPPPSAPAFGVGRLSVIPDDHTPGAELLLASTSFGAQVWNGETWSPFTDGCRPGAGAGALVVHRPGNAFDIFLGGTFLCAGTSGAAGVAQRIGCHACYPNCDNSTAAPILNIDDFTCFINEFATAQTLPPQQQITHYANCDGSTTAPVLNIDDFSCFINAFALGCP